jgi:carbamoyltransferase
MAKKILGISAFYHDSAAAIIEDGKIIAAAQEERFTRKKHDPAFPVNAVKFCLQYAGCTIDELDAIAFYDKPLLKFERLLETYYSFAPKGLPSFMTAIPVWLKEKMFLKKLMHDSLKEVGEYDKKKVKFLFPSITCHMLPVPIMFRHITKQLYSPLTVWVNGLLLPFAAVKAIK